MAFPHNEQLQDQHHQLQKQEQQQQQQQGRKGGLLGEEEDINIDNDTGTPKRYALLQHVYSATSPCVSASGSSNVMSKKIKARKLTPYDDDPNRKPSSQKPPIIHVYSRRASKRPRSFLDSLLAHTPELGLEPPVKPENCELDGDDVLGGAVNCEIRKKRRVGCSELMKLGVDSSVLKGFDGPRLRQARNSCNVSAVSRPRSAAAGVKRWVRLSFEGVDPKSLIGLQCKVYWPLDDDWYSGCVVGYSSETNRHQVEYLDGDEEQLVLSNEGVKFHVSREDMQQLKLSCVNQSVEGDGLDYDEMLALAASLDDSQEYEPGDIIWAKVTGHAMWPAIVVDESCIGGRKGLNRVSGGRSVPVQFFGTHDFAGVKTKQIISFLRGLVSSFHLKCKKPHFVQSLEEAKLYLSEQKLPKQMLWMQNNSDADNCESASGEDEGSSDSPDSSEDYIGDERKWRSLEVPKTYPFEIGDLQIISLGKIVKDSDYFQDDKSIWPEGYTVVRKFTSITDPSVCTLYRMEVLRDAESKIRPVFRVTLDNGEQDSIRETRKMMGSLLEDS